jgi:hypothetical protein
MKKQILVGVLLTAASLSATAVELTGNAGFVTDYIWRGADQSNGKAVAQGGLDLSVGDGPIQFYAGTWGSGVEYEFLDYKEGTDDETDSISGLEVDLYAGINGEISDFSWAVGGTFITYTDNVNPDYVEGIIALGFKWLTLDTAIGRFDQPGDPLDYIWTELGAELNGFFVKVGYTEWEEAVLPENVGALGDGGYGEVGFGDTLEWDGKEFFDYSITFIYSEADNLTTNQASNNVIFGITKNFSILQ